MMSYLIAGDLQERVYSDVCCFQCHSRGVPNRFLKLSNSPSYHIRGLNSQTKQQISVSDANIEITDDQGWLTLLYSHLVISC